ncbi:hypothetical protein [Streptomyces sp. NPDC014006]
MMALRGAGWTVRHFWYEPPLQCRGTAILVALAFMIFGGRALTWCRP